MGSDFTGQGCPNCTDKLYTIQEPLRLVHMSHTGYSRTHVSFQYTGRFFMMLALNYTAALLMIRTCYVTAVLDCVEWEHSGSVSLFVFFIRLSIVYCVRINIAC